MKRLTPRYLLIAVGITVGLLIASGIYQFFIELNREKARAHNEIYQMLDMVRASAGRAAYTLDANLAQRISEGFADNPIVWKVRIIDDFGSILGDAPANRLPPAPDSPVGLNINDNNLLIVALNSGNPDIHVGRLMVWIDASTLTAQFLSEIGRFFGRSLIWDLLLVLFLTIIFYLWLIKPLINMTYDLSKVDVNHPSDWSLTLPQKHEEDEMGELVNTLNDLLFRLSESMEKQQESEAAVISSLEEKEVLLKEIHHRVKNNLQIISSLLNLQTASLKDPDTKEAITESQNRISAMALVHEELYRSTNLSKIEMQDYLEKLTGKLRSIYSENRFINIDVLAKGIDMNINTSIVCGLIANELVTNALKYAFPDRREGNITVKLAFSEQFYSFVISDSGIGLPSGLNPEASESLGLRLVDGLVKQLKGSLSIRNSTGASFTIHFPKPREAELH